MANKNFLKNMSKTQEKMERMAGVNPYNQNEIAEEINKENHEGDINPHNSFDLDMGSFNFEEDSNNGNDFLNPSSIEDDEDFMPTFEEVMSSRRGNKTSSNNGNIANNVNKDVNAEKEQISIDKHQEEIDQIKEDYESVISKLNEKIKEQNKSLEEASQINEKYLEAQKEIKSLKAEVDNYSSKLKEMSELENSNDSDNKVSQEDYDKLIDEIEELKTLNKQYQEDYKAINDKSRGSTRKIANLEKKLEEKEKSEEELNNLIAELKNKIQELESIKEIPETYEVKTPEVEDDSIKEVKAEDVKVDSEVKVTDGKPNEVSVEVLNFVCNKTIGNMYDTYESEMYKTEFAKKLFNDYITGEVNGSDPLFNKLLQEAIEKGTKDPYLEDLTEKVLNYIQNN